MIKWRTWRTRTGWKNLICWAFTEQKVSRASYCWSRVTRWKGYRQGRTRLLRCQSDATRSNKGNSHWIQENHRVVDVGKPLQEVILSSSPAQPGSPRAGCPEPYWASFWISPKMEALQPLQATCSSAHVIAAQTLGKYLFTRRWVEHLLREVAEFHPWKYSKVHMARSNPLQEVPLWTENRPDDLQRSLPKQILLGFSGILFINQSFLSGHKATEQQKVSQ